MSRSTGARVSEQVGRQLPCGGGAVCYSTVKRMACRGEATEVLHASHNDSLSDNDAQCGLRGFQSAGARIRRCMIL